MTVSILDDGPAMLLKWQCDATNAAAIRQSSTAGAAAVQQPTTAAISAEEAAL